MPTILRETRRRFILGKQGLWPGQRWRGKRGVLQAVKACEMVQVDPTVVVAQSQDIVLWGRVLDYEARFLTELLYKDRKLFDYGGGLAIYPMEEMPYHRAVMKRKRKEKRWATFAKENAALVKRVKREIERRGPLGSRDLEGEVTSNYRSGKDTGVALYYLWLGGELMIVGRNGKERVYALLEKSVPGQFDRVATDKEMEEFFARKAISLGGIISRRGFRNTWKGLIERYVDHAEGQRKLQQMLKGGAIEEVELRGEREPYYVLSEDLPLIEKLVGNQVPKEWKALDATNEQEVIFLSPLELVSARGRAKTLFDFHYLWEIYKPASKRKYGPYTMPILYSDQLVGRADFKMDRENRVLLLNGVWLEDWFRPSRQFGQAFMAGLDRFLEFLQAASVEPSKTHIRKNLSP